MLGDRALVAHIARFQRGISMRFEELRAAHAGRYRWAFRQRGPSKLWGAIMREGELRLVKQLYYMRSLPENEGVALLQMDDVPACAVAVGRLDVLQWLHSIDPHTAWSGALLYQAISKNRYEIVRWLMHNRPEACVDATSKCLAAAAAEGNLDLLKEMIAL